MSENSHRKRYPSDITDEQWEILVVFLPKPPTYSPRRPIPQREIVNGILYLLRTGCSWRQMPHDLPNGKTVYDYFRQWKLDGTWERVMTALRKHVRAQAGREPEPSAAIIDSQSIKTSPVRGSERGYDGGKKNLGRKRHLLVDTLGLLLAVKVHSAGIVDSRGAPLLLQDRAGRFPRLCLLYADSASAGTLPIWIKAHLGWQTEIVPKPQARRGFQVVPQRWKIERTLGWVIRYRRLARDYEGLPSSSEALIQIAAIRLSLTRLTLFRPLSL